MLSEKLLSDEDRSVANSNKSAASISPELATTQNMFIIALFYYFYAVSGVSAFGCGLILYVGKWNLPLVRFVSVITLIYKR